MQRCPGQLVDNAHARAPQIPQETRKSLSATSMPFVTQRRISALCEREPRPPGARLKPLFFGLACLHLDGTHLPNVWRGTHFPNPVSLAHQDARSGWAIGALPAGGTHPSAGRRNGHHLPKVEVDTRYTLFILIFLVCLPIGANISG